MPTLFAPPRYSPVNGNGQTLPGAKLEFYQSGTSDLQDTYSDGGLTTPNANPVVADADGLFGPIYLGTAADYKVIMKDASGTIIYTVDPVPRSVTGATIGANGTVQVVQDGTLTFVSALNKTIYGLTYANNGTDATNDIDIATGGAIDATGAYFMVLASALTKRLDAVWSVGTNQGGLDTGTIANTNYYVWLIARSDTGVVDVLFSTSSTAPTMPTSYDYKRLIGWIKRASNAIVAFKTTETAGGGLYYRWVTPSDDIDSTTLGDTRVTTAVRVPLHIQTKSHLRILAGHSTTTFGVVVCNPDETDASPLSTGTPGTTFFSSSSGDLFACGEIWVLTDSTGRVSYRSSTASTSFVAITLGFEWSRRT